MPACQACHRSKVKCDGGECIPRVSRQGQGPKRRKIRTEDETIVRSLPMEAHHYGIRYLVYSWTSFALTRKSFRLLARASTLAAEGNISMDEVLHGRKDVLQSILFEPDKPDESVRLPQIRPSPIAMCLYEKPTEDSRVIGLPRHVNETYVQFHCWKKLGGPMKSPLSKRFCKVRPSLPSLRKPFSTKWFGTRMLRKHRRVCAYPTCRY